MKATFQKNELTATVRSSYAVAESSAVQIVATVTAAVISIASAQVKENDASDAIFLLIIQDENGEPILDVNGQYIIGG